MYVFKLFIDECIIKLTYYISIQQDPKDFVTAYDKMLIFLADTNNQKVMQEELGGRGVKCMNFYDVLIDFMLLDAFDEVERPPTSIKAILQNRWISASFRETVILKSILISYLNS